MTTPIERATEAFSRHGISRLSRECYCDCGAPIGEWASDYAPHIASVAIEAALSDREGLARMLYRRDTPDDADFWDNGLPDNFKRIWLLEADAIIAWLTDKTGDAS